MLNKTKAGWQTCPCEYLKQQTQSIKSHGLKPEFKNELWKDRAQKCALGYSSEVSALEVKLFSACVLFLLRRNFLLVSINDSSRKCMGLFAGSVSSGCWFFRSSAMRYPLGSMPCLRSSCRASSLNQFPRLTPSRAAAFSSCSLNSGSRRKLNRGDLPAPFGLLSLLIVDMYIPVEIVSISLGIYPNMLHVGKTTPCSATNTYRASNHHR